MTNKPDLNDIDISEYDNGELADFAIKIINEAGSDAAWKTLEASADLLVKDTKCWIIAIRRNPDCATVIDVISYRSKPGGFDDAKNHLIPMAAMSAYQSCLLAKDLAAQIGVGPQGIMEMINGKIVEIAKSYQDY